MGDAGRDLQSIELAVARQVGRKLEAILAANVVRHSRLISARRGGERRSSSVTFLVAVGVFARPSPDGLPLKGGSVLQATAIVSMRLLSMPAGHVAAKG
jgi:hypothetical protein